MKKYLLMALLILGASANASRYEYDVITPLDMIAGDKITVLNGTVVSDNSKPWLAASLSTTAVTIGDVAGNTASAVNFDWVVPSNFKGDAALFIVGTPAAADTTVKFQADVQVQPRAHSASPVTINAVTTGSESTALAAGDIDNLNWISLPNTALDNLTERDRRKKVSIYVGRSSGTGENFLLYNAYIRYSFRSEYNRLRD